MLAPGPPSGTPGSSPAPERRNPAVTGTYHRRLEHISAFNRHNLVKAVAAAADWDYDLNRPGTDSNPA